VHAYDAQEAVGRPEPVPASIALDSISEFLVVSLGADGPWPHEPARLLFAAAEGPSWTLDLTTEGAKVTVPGGVEPVTTVRGAASDLILALFGRVPLDRLHLDGDHEVVEQLLGWVDTE
jgi:hypothetical protein